MYETREQTEGVWDAKGIETVRRDTCPAVSKMLERTLKVLFETKDVSRVKAYVIGQFQKMQEGRVSPLEYVFATELRSHYKHEMRHAVPMIANRMRQSDPRSYPEIGERVPYVVTATGVLSSRLIDGVVSVREAIVNPLKLPNVRFYIEKRIVPALDRFLTLEGCSAAEWYRSVPKPERTSAAEAAAADAAAGAARGGTDGVTSRLVASATTILARGPVGVGGAVRQQQENQSITRFAMRMQCIVCNTSVDTGARSVVVTRVGRVCSSCLDNPSRSLVVLGARVRRIEEREDAANAICVNCVGTRALVDACESIDCQLYVERLRVRDKIKEAQRLELTSDRLVKML